MKTVNFTKALTLLIILAQLVACGSKRSLNRQHVESSSLEKTVGKAKELQLQAYSRNITLSDSTESLYRIVIYPADSFQFSVKEGFKGKAKKVEISGLTKRQLYVSDTTTAALLHKTEQQAEAVSETRHKSSLITKSVNRTKSYWIPGAVLLALVIWGLRKLILHYKIL